MPNDNDRKDTHNTPRTTETQVTPPSYGDAGSAAMNAPKGSSATTNTKNADPSVPRQKQHRGFAAMDPSKQKAIASKGGKASHEQGTGHEWDSERAREAGRKGGQASRGGRGKLKPGETEAASATAKTPGDDTTT